MNESEQNARCALDVDDLLSALEDVHEAKRELEQMRKEISAICSGKEGSQMSLNAEKYSGDFMETIIQSAIQAVENSRGEKVEISEMQKDLWDRGARWAKVYYETGELILPTWALLVRIRQRLCDGANNDGQMSPGAVDAYYDLQPIQEEFVMGE